MSKTLSIVVLTENGEINVACAAMMREDFEAQLTKECARMATDFNSVAVEINAYLIANPKLRTVPTSALIRSLWETRVENGELKGKTHEEKATMFARLEEVVPEYVKAHGDRFHMGRKTGIAIRFVEGEVVKDAEGNPLYNAEGDETQAYRHSAEEWTKITAAKAEKDAAATAAK